MGPQRRDRLGAGYFVESGPEVICRHGVNLVAFSAKLTDRDSQKVRMPTKEIVLV